jgi:hypothetical protein
MNNPYYDENQAWMHPTHTAQDAHLQQLQTHWYEQQEADRQHQFYMHSTQNDFANLQAAAQQAAPHRHHHNGPSMGTVVGLSLWGLAIAHQANLRHEVAAGLRPANLKDGSVLGWYLMGAVVLHVLLGALATSGVAFWLVCGSIVWIPAWILGIRHQIRNSAYNRAVWEQFNQPRHN